VFPAAARSNDAHWPALMHVCIVFWTCKLGIAKSEGRCLLLSLCNLTTIAAVLQLEKHLQMFCIPNAYSVSLQDTVVSVQCCSSEKSPQSFSPSHIQVWGMHCPFAHSNWWVLQASPLTKLAPNPSCKTRNVKSSRGRHWCHLKWRTILDIIGGLLLFSLAVEKQTGTGRNFLYLTQILC